MTTKLHQPSLFDLPVAVQAPLSPDGLDEFGQKASWPAPLARTTDPQTSHDAAEAIANSDAYDIALDSAIALTAMHGNFTANELGEHGSKIPNERGKKYREESIRKRYVDLLADNKIVRLFKNELDAEGNPVPDTRVCRVTGIAVHTYRAVRGT